GQDEEVHEPLDERRLARPDGPDDPHVNAAARAFRNVPKDVEFLHLRKAPPSRCASLAGIVKHGQPRRARAKAFGQSDTSTIWGGEDAYDRSWEGRPADFPYRDKWAASSLGSRSMSSETASRGRLPMKSTSPTARVIGISTPWALARSRAARVVGIPSIT